MPWCKTRRSRCGVVALRHRHGNDGTPGLHLIRDGNFDRVLGTSIVSSRQLACCHLYYIHARTGSRPQIDDCGAAASPLEDIAFSRAQLRPADPESGYRTPALLPCVGRVPSQSVPVPSSMLYGPSTHRPSTFRARYGYHVQSPRSQALFLCDAQETGSVKRTYESSRPRFSVVIWLQLTGHPWMIGYRHCASNQEVYSDHVFDCMRYPVDSGSG